MQAANRDSHNINSSSSSSSSSSLAENRCKEELNLATATGVSCLLLAIFLSYQPKQRNVDLNSHFWSDFGGCRYFCL